MNEVWRARSGIVARGCARGRVRSRRGESGRRYVAAAGSAADPRSPQGRIYPLACLVAIAVCAFTAAGNDRFTAVGQWIRRAPRQTWPGCALRGTRSRAGTGRRMRRRSGSCWTVWTRGPWPGPCSGRVRAAAGVQANGLGKRARVPCRRAAGQAQSAGPGTVKGSGRGRQDPPGEPAAPLTQ